MLWPVAPGIEAVTRMIAPRAAAMLVRVPVADRQTTMRPRQRLRPYRTPPPEQIASSVIAGPIEPRQAGESALPAEPKIIAPFVPISPRRSLGRFAASAWLVARQGEDRTGGQLGASQIGMRGTYMIDRERRVAVSARLSAPFAEKGREAAFGVDWQPLPAPVHLIAERRIALDGGRGGTALFVIGGIGPRQIAARMRVEAYGQAGAVVRDGIERFADGAARLSYDLGAVGGVDIDAGAGAWGGAQRGAARLDIGPSLGVRLPVSGQAIRLTLDWRQRLVGAARPGSGPALSIGSDF